MMPLILALIAASATAFAPPVVPTGRAAASNSVELGAKRDGVFKRIFRRSASTLAAKKRGAGYGAPVDNISETVGNTPMVRINRLAPEGVTIYAKCGTCVRS